MYRGWRITAVMVLAMWTVSALAGDGPAAVRNQIEASMLLTGEIEVDAHGGVVSHRIDQVEKVPASVIGILSREIPQWTFEPVVVGGKAVPARSKMLLRVVARQLDDGDYAVSVRDADFPGEPPPPGTHASSREVVGARYPTSALRAGLSGVVYVAVKVGPDGKVEDAVAEQVNLPFLASERSMADARKLFADASVRAAKSSTFDPPTASDHAGGSTSMRMSFQYQVEGGPQIIKPYGQWVTYVPGPYQPAPWRVGESDSSPDLLSVGAGPQPLTGAAGKLHLLTRIGDEG